jgi:hypothetical protein
VSQHVTLPGIFSNKARRSVSLDIIQPAHAPLQTAPRSVKLDPPQVNGVRGKADLTLATCIGNALK